MNNFMAFPVSEMLSMIYFPWGKELPSVCLDTLSFTVQKMSVFITVSIHKLHLFTSFANCRLYRIRVILLSVFTHNPGKDGGSRSFDVLEGPLASQGSSSPSLNRHSRGLYLLRCQWSAGRALVICRSIDSVRNWIDSSSLPERGGDLLRS